MANIIFYKPLKVPGDEVRPDYQVRLDLDDCPRRVVVPEDKLGYFDREKTY
jgi:hypothetical protein